MENPMLRFISLTLALSLPMLAHAATLKDFELNKMLEKVARESSVGTPRAINEDILDQGYTVDGSELVNHLSVRSEHAAQMRGNPDVVRAQLANSVRGVMLERLGPVVWESSVAKASYALEELEETAKLVQMTGSEALENLSDAQIEELRLNFDAAW